MIKENLSSSKNFNVFNTKTKIVIVILNWNLWRCTIKCLESVFNLNYSNYEVIVVDNGSHNDSINKIMEYALCELKINCEFLVYDPKEKLIKFIELNESEFKSETYINNNIKSVKKLSIIQNDRNYGFAKGCNIGIRWALNSKADYILILNNDTVIDKDFIEPMLKFSEDEDVWMMGPKTYFYGNKNLIHSGGGYLDLFWGTTKHIGLLEEDHGQYDQVQSVNFMTGCALMLKKEMLNDIGLFDESYFTYYEDADLCFRVFERGKKILYVPQSKIWHRVSQTSGNFNPTTSYYLTRNRLKFIKDHKPKYLIFSFIHILLVDLFVHLSKLKFNNVKMIFKGIYHFCIGKYGYYSD